MDMPQTPRLLQTGRISAVKSKKRTLIRAKPTRSTSTTPVPDVYLPNQLELGVSFVKSESERSVLIGATQPNGGDTAVPQATPHGLSSASGRSGVVSAQTEGRSRATNTSSTQRLAKKSVAGGSSSVTPNRQRPINRACGGYSSSTSDARRSRSSPSFPSSSEMTRSSPFSRSAVSSISGGIAMTVLPPEVYSERVASIVLPLSVIRTFRSVSGSGSVPESESDCDADMCLTQVSFQHPAPNNPRDVRADKVQVTTTPIHIDKGAGLYEPPYTGKIQVSGPIVHDHVGR